MEAHARPAPGALAAVAAPVPLDNRGARNQECNKRQALEASATVFTMAREAESHFFGLRLPARPGLSRKEPVAVVQ